MRGGFSGTSKKPEFFRVFHPAAAEKFEKTRPFPRPRPLFTAPSSLLQIAFFHSSKFWPFFRPFHPSLFEIHYSLHPSLFSIHSFLPADALRRSPNSSGLPVPFSPLTSHFQNQNRHAQKARCWGHWFQFARKFTMRNTFSTAHPNIQPFSEATVLRGAEDNTRGEKSPDFLKKSAEKKFSTKSTAPPAAGAKRSVAEKCVGVSLGYPNTRNLEKLDFPEGNSRFTSHERWSTPTRNLKFRASHFNLARSSSHTARH